MKSSIISTTSAAISSGGTITGDLTISGDLTVEGGGGFSYSEVLTGDFQIVGADGTVSGTADADANEFIIRNDGDAGMSILAAEDSGETSSIIFGSASDLNGANIFYEYNTKTMKLGTQHASGILTLRSGNGSDAITIDASQNVGIGVSDPDQDVEIKKSSANVTLKINAATAANDAELEFATGDTVNWKLWVDGSKTNDPLKFYDTASSSNAMCLNNSNIGIGTVSPAGTASKSVLDIENVTTNSATQGGNLRLGANDGTVMVATDRLGVIEFAGAEDTSSTMTVGARIEAVADATWSASENGADMVFYTTDGDASQSEVMRLTADNLVGIGTDAPTYKLDVVGDIGVSDAIYHNDDTDTGMHFGADDIHFVVGNVAMLRMLETTQNEVIINEDQGDIDFRVESDGATHALFVQASDGNVGIGTAAPNAAAKLHVLDTDSDAVISLESTNSDGRRWSFIASDNGGFYLKDESVGIRVGIDTAGNVGIGDSSPDAHLDVENTAINTTDSYIGIYSNHQKTHGATNASDEFIGIKNFMDFDDDASLDSLFGSLMGIENSVVCTDSVGESSAMYGIRSTAQLIIGDINNVYGSNILVDIDGGTVDADVYGQYTNVDIDGGTLSNDVVGHYININTTVNPSAKVSGLKIVMAGGGVSANGDDHFLFCYDAENDDTTAQITALGGVATFDGGDFDAAPDYAEYFESKDGKAIAIGKTVKLDGDKIVSCSEGDTPIGVVRPKKSSSVVCNAKTLRYHGKYLQTDYDEVQMEDYTQKKWTVEVDFDEYIKRGKTEQEQRQYSKVEGSKEVLYVEGDELPEGKEVGDVKTAAVADTFFREHCYHSDRIPDGITAPDDAETLTPAHQRKKLNPDYDPSKDYVKRADRDEWCLVGLLGQIPVTKGQPTGSWIKMKDVSDTVEMYFVK